MRKLILASTLALASAFVFAQKTDIKGNTNINAVAGKQTAVAVGKNNVAKNTVGAIKSGTSIKGNTNINAVAGKQTAVAVGKGNKAENTVGEIGGK